jgi:hypothetical protein
MNRLAQLSPLLDVLVDEYVARLLRISQGGASPQSPEPLPMPKREQVKPLPPISDSRPGSSAEPVVVPGPARVSTPPVPTARRTPLRSPLGQVLDQEALS